MIGRVIFYGLLYLLFSVMPVRYWSFDTQENFTVMEGDQQSSRSVIVPEEVRMFLILLIISTTKGNIR